VRTLRNLDPTVKFGVAGSQTYLKEEEAQLSKIMYDLDIPLKKAGFGLDGFRKTTKKDGRKNEIRTVSF